jgi:hypothetical protein
MGVLARSIKKFNACKERTKGVYGPGGVFTRGERVESKLLPKFSPSVSEIRRAVPRKSK